MSKRPSSLIHGLSYLYYRVDRPMTFEFSAASSRFIDGFPAERTSEIPPYFVLRFSLFFFFITEFRLFRAVLIVENSRDDNR